MEIPAWSLISTIHVCFSSICINPLSHHDALKHHLKTLKTDLIPLQLTVLEGKFPCNSFTNTWQFSVIFYPHQSSSSTTRRELRQQFAACSG